MPDDGNLHELHNGEVVLVTRPKFKHERLQHRFYDLLKPKLQAFGMAVIEFAYRPLPEFELRGADVAVVSRSRAEAIDPEDNLHGAPDLVIEVMSPSNTKAALRALATLCLANGAREFWVADERVQTITVLRRDGSQSVYNIGDAVPLTAFGSDSLSVSEIFD
jgi:Uma2 family endonuclease